MFETTAFFRASSQLHTAHRTGDEESAQDALMDLAGLWLHAKSRRLQSRCEHLLLQHGMRPVMDQIIKDWAL